MAATDLILHKHNLLDLTSCCLGFNQCFVVNKLHEVCLDVDVTVTVKMLTDDWVLHLMWQCTYTSV